MRWMVVVIGLVACDDGAGEGGGGGIADAAAPPAGDTYEAGMEKAGAAGALTLRLAEARPAPPAIGDNTWIIEVVDTAGQVLEGCTLAAEPLMPAHGHGATRPAVVAPVEAGYEVAPLDLFMPGLWEVTLTATCGALSDAATFAFWIEG